MGEVGHIQQKDIDIIMKSVLNMDLKSLRISRLK